MAVCIQNFSESIYIMGKKNKTRVEKLRMLALKLYNLSRREVWTGGIITRELLGKKDCFGYPTHKLVAHGWPFTDAPQNWQVDTTFSISPPVEIGGIKLSICISMESYSGNSGKHKVSIYADRELKYPGGAYLALNKKDSWIFKNKDAWSREIAKMEQEDGGKTGYVDKTDLILAEADDKLLQSKSNKYCPYCESLLATLDEELEL